MTGKVLLVEGADDRDFFQAVLAYSMLQNVNIAPKTPRQVDASIKKDGVGNLLIALELQLKTLNQVDGIDRLGIVVDADHATNDPSCNFGFSVRRKQVADVLAAQGWLPTSTPSTKGELFRHPDGLPDVGLWVMPDHGADGMLEDFVMPLIAGVDQQRLFQHAQATVGNLPVTLFNPKLHTTKACVATWRAWQKSPGGSLGKVLQSEALDLTLSPASEFIGWLKVTFS